MAEARHETATPSPTANGTTSFWTNLFRCFAIALIDPRKLLAAALGIIVVSLGWFVLSCIFHYQDPTRSDQTYQPEAMKKTLGAKKPNGEDYTNDEYIEKGIEQHGRDHDRWLVINDLAGPRGKLSTMPWNEFRGENPFLFVSRISSQPSATWVPSLGDYLLKQIPVLTEPLQKLLIPVIRMLDPNASFGTRLYLLLCLAWSLAVWAFFAGIITRLAAVQLSGKERSTLMQAVKFVCSRYLSYILSPIVPLGVIAAIVLGLFLYGLIALIPLVGDIVFYGLLFPVILVGGIAMAFVVLGLAGYPLMYCTISSEGSDTFDAVSRSYNYVFQAPWTYIWYSFCALLYGAAITFVVIFVGCLTVVMGKWAIGSAAGVTTIESRRPDYLFAYAPESLGWKELLLKGSPLAVKQDKEGTKLVDVSETSAKEYRDSMTWGNYAAAGMASFWMVFVFLLMIGFGYSYFWTAYTMVYLQMRKKLDDVEVDDVYVDDLTAPLTQAASAAPLPAPPPASTPPAGGVSLPMVAADTPKPSPVVPPTVPPVVLPTVPPVVSPTVPPVVSPTVPPVVPPVVPPATPPVPPVAD
jgi:hypothetical protein